MSSDQGQAKPPRSALTMRDMIVALLVLGLVVLVVGGATRSCTFSPGGPTVDQGALPVVDAPAQLRALAPQVPFTVRIPAVPPGWRSNSVDQDRVRTGDVDAGRAVRTGFVTPEGRYLRLLQSDATEQDLLAVESPGAPTRGAVDVAGQRFVIYGGPGDEPLWIGLVPTPDAEPVRVSITGSGVDDEFRALAGGVLTGEILPRGTAPG